MYNFSIGVILDSFKKSIPESLKLAADMGVQGIQAYATYGELSPQKLTGEKRREFLLRVKDAGLTVSALCGDLGMGFGNEKANPGLIERSKRIMELARELETKVVTTHIGVVPGDSSHPRYRIMQDACGALAAAAHSMDAYFAVETGPEPSAVLKGFLDGMGCRGIAVNFDPANLVMVCGEKPAEAVNNLKDYIVHTHAKDGRPLFFKEPEKIYGLKPDDQAPSFVEMPLGEGNVNFPEYLRALYDAGYKGFLTIERETGEKPAEDIRAAADFLHRLILSEP